MRLTIDNLDGRGAVEYTAALSADSPLKIERALNAPSRCIGSLLIAAAPTLAVPVRHARIVVSADSGTALFTGYIAAEPAPVYSGAGLGGPVYRYAFTAAGDEWLLDKQAPTLAAGGFALSGATLLPARTSRTHTINFDDATAGGALQIAELPASNVKELANDVTLTGQIEPSQYVTEMFSGDGTTAVFAAANEPFRAAKPKLIADSFDGPAIDTHLWNVADSGSHISLGGAGLALTGGTGFDGQTTLTASDQVEMGGTLVVEAGSVALTSPSNGVLCGLYSGSAQRANCFAGYNVRQSGGSTVVTPFVNGAEIGTSYTLLDGHRYTLRIRLHSPEMQRVMQTYYARVDGVIEAFGGGLVASPMSLVFELQDLGNASNTPATVLYDGAIAESPARCTFAAVNSVELNGSMGFCAVTQTGSAWIVSTLPGGATQTRLIGIAGEGVDCQMDATGKVTFFAGRIPEAGEIVTILYRTRNRAVARLQDDAGVAAEAAGGMPGTAHWLGKVVKPLARSSADCESAEQAILSLASSRAAAIAGNYAASNPAADIWPGDVLAITANRQTMNVVVRQVSIVDGHAVPEFLAYRIAIANDWAGSLGITLSEAIAADAHLPAAALSAPDAVLDNLQQLTVVSATGSALQIDAGTNPPAGGGFEVRLRDWDFGPGHDHNLVLRSPVRRFSIPRSAQVERYFVRMYDASIPPIYSRLSSAIFTHLPVA